MTPLTGAGGRAAPRLPKFGGGPLRVLAWRPFFMLLLLASLLVQGTAVQTHLHFAARPITASASDGAVPVAKAGGNDASADCLLCQEAAMAGAYLLPPIPVLQPPPQALLEATAAAIFGFILLAPALGWRSRAPPL